MMKALLLSIAITAGVPAHSTLAAIAAGPKVEEAVSTRQPDLDAKKRAWFEREMEKILDGQSAPLDAQR